MAPEPSRGNHERMLHHLKNATKHFDASRKKVEASLQAHLEAHPPITPPPPIETDDDDTTDTN